MEGRFPVPVRPERIGVIIGKGGRNRRALEEAFNVKLEVDSNSATVYIVPKEETTPYNVMRAKQAIVAISLGFSVDAALKLSDDAYHLEIINLKDVTKHERDLHRIKSRIIGAEGKARKMIEDMAEVEMVIGDREVGIIGEYENVRVAREAIEMLIAGKSHQTVYRYLRNARRELERRKAQLWQEWRPFT